jgi:hypothetical protein
LGSKEVAVRLGGIYALEGVINTSDQYHQPALEALSAFVREGAKPPTPLVNNELPPVNAKPPTDIQAALTAIGRRSPGKGDVNLSGVSIAGADLSRAELGRADLSHADITGANLSGANLSGTNLSHADLRGANLSAADLSRAYLRGGHLGLANLSGADLSRAYLRGAHLSLANLSGANLRSADLDGQKQLNEACGSEAVLPTGLTLKPCSP